MGGYISRTFITVQQGAMLQMNYYFQEPVVESYLLTAERLAGKLDPPERTRSLVPNGLADNGEVGSWRTDP